MKKYKVHIPDESYVIISFEQDGLPSVGVVNIALRDFEYKEVFAWHLSLIIDFKELIDNGMPAISEREIVDPFGDELDVLIKGELNEKPNALFLSRTTWNKTRQLIWRVYDPEIVNEALQEIIKKDLAPRPFEFRMEYDESWELAKWYLQNMKENKEAFKI